MQAANYANALRQQQIGEAMGRRGQSLNEINALLSGQQVGMPQMPTFMPGPLAILLTRRARKSPSSIGGSSTA